MFVTLLDPQINSQVLAGEALTNGDTVQVRYQSGVLQAFKTAVAAGKKCTGFATIDPTSPVVNIFPLTLAQFQSVAPVPVGSGAFNLAETLQLGWRILVQEGIGTAMTSRVQAATYHNGDDLAANGDGTLKLAGTGDFVLATARETKVLVAGDKLYIEFNAVAPRVK